MVCPFDIIIIFSLLGLAIVGNSFAFQTLATDGAGGLGRLEMTMVMVFGDFGDDDGQELAVNDDGV